jgi:hypothetical protein
MVLGKHSGRHALVRAYAEQLNTSLTAEQATSLLARVRRFVTEHKRSPETGDLRGFLSEIDLSASAAISPAGSPAISPVGSSVVSPATSPLASLRLQ